MSVRPNMYRTWRTRRVMNSRVVCVRLIPSRAVCRQGKLLIFGLRGSIYLLFGTGCVPCLGFAAMLAPAAPPSLLARLASSTDGLASLLKAVGRARFFGQQRRLRPLAGFSEGVGIGTGTILPTKFSRNINNTTPKYN